MIGKKKTQGWSGDHIEQPGPAHFTFLSPGRGSNSRSRILFRNAWLHCSSDSSGVKLGLLPKVCTEIHSAKLVCVCVCVSSYRDNSGCYPWPGCEWPRLVSWPPRCIRKAHLARRDTAVRGSTVMNRNTRLKGKVWDTHAAPKIASQAVERRPGAGTPQPRAEIKGCWQKISWLKFLSCYKNDHWFNLQNKETKAFSVC